MPLHNNIPLVVRFVIGTLQYDPDRVKAELNVMKSRGQKKIALVIWHVDNIGTGSYNGVVSGINISSGNGRLDPQQQSNLSAFLDDVRQIGSKGRGAASKHFDNSRRSRVGGVPNAPESS